LQFCGWCWRVIELLLRWLTGWLIADTAHLYRDHARKHCLGSHWRLIANVWREFARCKTNALEGAQSFDDHRQRSSASRHQVFEPIIRGNTKQVIVHALGTNDHTVGRVGRHIKQPPEWPNFHFSNGYWPTVQ
jgi:hypothetical protein